MSGNTLLLPQYDIKAWVRKILHFILQHARCSAETNSTDRESLENVTDRPVYHTGVAVVIIVVLVAATATVVVVVVIPVQAVAVVVVVVLFQQ